MRYRIHEPPGMGGQPPAAIWLLLLAGERPKEKPLGRGRTGEFAEASAFETSSVEHRFQHALQFKTQYPLCDARKRLAGFSANGVCQSVAVLTAKDIVTFDDAPVPAGESPWVGDHGPQTGVEIARPDPAWPQRYATLAALIREALGERVLAIEHVGSTSVPGLPAKPIIDIDLAVADPDDEASYVPALQRCGFVLVVREWWWYGHRLMHHADPTCHLHVFAADCPENARHRIFRDWLRSHPEDRALYARAKAAAAEETNCAGGHGMDYNGRKEAVVREIYARAFHELGLTAKGPSASLPSGGAADFTLRLPGAQ